MSENISEIDVLAVGSDFKKRKLLLELLDMKKQIDAEMASENTTAERGMHLAAAKELVQDNIMQLRMDGIW